MKTLLVLMAFTAGLASCTKSNEVDPRDQYLGAYQVTASTVTTVAATGKQSTSKTSYILVVTRATDPKTLSFSDAEPWSGTLNGSGFTINPYVSKQVANNLTYNYSVTGSGAFNSNTITYTENVVGNGIISTNSITGSKAK